MAIFAPLLNIVISLAMFFIEGNTPVLNEILQMCMRGFDITEMTLATLSVLCFIFYTRFYSVNNLLLINGF